MRWLGLLMHAVASPTDAKRNILVESRHSTAGSMSWWTFRGLKETSNLFLDLAFHYIISTWSLLNEAQACRSSKTLRSGDFKFSRRRESELLLPTKTNALHVVAFPPCRKDQSHRRTHLSLEDSIFPSSCIFAHSLSSFIEKVGTSCAQSAYIQLVQYSAGAQSPPRRH